MQHGMQLRIFKDTVQRGCPLTDRESLRTNHRAQWLAKECSHFNTFISDTGSTACDVIAVPMDINPWTTEEAQLKVAMSRAKNSLVIFP